MLQGRGAMPSNDDPITSGVQKTPGVRGGEACIRNTRHTVSARVQSRRLGLTDARILEHHPDLTLADLETAWSSSLQNCEEIDRAIREDEDA
jgi:uncharacterized protein (DUF433 family)